MTSILGAVVDIIDGNDNSDTDGDNHDAFHEETERQGERQWMRSHRNENDAHGNDASKSTHDGNPNQQ